MNAVIPPVAGWLLTYLVHSTLLLGCAWLLTRYVVRRESLRETLWKTALVGGLVTATAATVLPRPGGFRVELAALSVGRAATVPAGGPSGALSEGVEHVLVDGLDQGLAESDLDAALEAGLDGQLLPELEAELGPETARSLEGGAGPEQAGDGPAAPERAGEGAANDSPGESGAGPAGRSLHDAAAGGVVGLASRAATWAVVVWLVIALALLGRLIYRHTRLRLLLRGREQVPGSVEAASVLTELRRSAGVWTPVRLTSTPSVATPLALGRVEICLPARFLDELDPEEQRAALAHELAHLTRRDPIWQIVGAVVGALFFFQPLNHVARNHIRAAAEYMADGWAVRHTGAQVELARCLASVAGWVAPSAEPALAGTVAMAEGGSPLLVRVQRLLEHEPEQATSPALRVAVAALVLAVAAGFGPAVGAASAAGEPDAPLAADGSGPRTDSNPNLGGNTNSNTDANTNTDANATPATVASDVADAEVAQRPLDVRRLDDIRLDGAGLAVRLNEAVRDAAGSPHWVAYAVEGDGVEEMVIDSDPWSNRELDGPGLGDRLAISEEVRNALEEPVIVLVRLVPEGAATRVDRITVRRPELGADLGGTVYWLGSPSMEESFRWFRDLYETAQDPAVRATAVEVMGIHRVPGVGDVLRGVLTSARDNDVRGEAAEALGRQEPDTATARLLFDVALNDEDRGVRQQATEALARVEPGLAVELLARLTRESDDDRVQRQAAESLADVGTPAAVAVLEELVTMGRSGEVRTEALDQLTRLRRPASAETLLTMAMADDDPELRREAVELLGTLPPEEAVPLLRRIVFESGDGTAERQAAETLGDVGTDAAFQVLTEVLRRNPSEDASFQAVEAVAENFSSEQALPLLREVLDNHPSRKVRLEALDRLADVGG